MNFKEKHLEEERINESNKILVKYPTRIPIIVERQKNCGLAMINKQKFLVPRDMSVSQFVCVIRKRIELEPSQALFVMINHKLSPAQKKIGEVYEDDADKDGFLYITYTSENTFG